MSFKRREKRRIQRHTQALAIYLSDFYTFLGSKPKPDNDMVRQCFIEYDTLWRRFVKAKDLPEELNDEFKRQVSEVWNRKKEEKR